MKQLKIQLNQIIIVQKHQHQQQQKQEKDLKEMERKL